MEEKNVLLTLVEYASEVEKNVAKYTFIHNTLEFSNHKFYFMLRYFSATKEGFFGRKYWTLGSGHWSLDAARWKLASGRRTLHSGLSTVNTSMDWFTTESESSFGFCLIKLLNFFEWESLRTSWSRLFYRV